VCCECVSVSVRARVVSVCISGVSVECVHECYECVSVVSVCFVGVCVCEGVCECACV